MPGDSLQQQAFSWVLNWSTTYSSRPSLACKERAKSNLLQHKGRLTRLEANQKQFGTGATPSFHDVKRLAKDNNVANLVYFDPLVVLH